MLPGIFWVRRPAPPALADPGSATTAALAGLDLGNRTSPGRSVAVAVGSRGIADLAGIVAATVGHLRSLGLEPFVVPAMGSHGGGTAEGQRAVLDALGVTEEAVGCAVRSQMDVVELARPEPGLPIHLDRAAAAADHVVLVNRIKPHTMFDGPVESGLVKMLLIGLGNAEGAATVHRAAVDRSWPAVVRAGAPVALARAKVLAGVAVVEDAGGHAARVEALAANDVLDRETALLVEARAHLPRLPVADLDVVLVDRIGKDISGTGFDPNVLGRKGSVHEIRAGAPARVRTIVVRGLSPGTGGNALGVGLAELCRSRVVRAMDAPATWLNAETSGDLAAAMVPMHHETDAELLAACRSSTGLREQAGLRLCWVRDTRDLGVVACTEPLLAEVAADPDLAVIGDVVAMPFDRHGNLPDLLPDPPDV